MTRPGGHVASPGVGCVLRGYGASSGSEAAHHGGSINQSYRPVALGISSVLNCKDVSILQLDCVR